ncbi:RelE/StbE family toxin [Oleiphilus messinensis]|uniref:RelE/StbE family toxin n=1 Tax=Oleiphilus messinensis TaxID=141451 RepID=A0A1Y0IAT0_9GAMM|nr:type II toxin-antitoxin system RelE/ParE family toxin [Oleiphilus messinensis]ARU57269.1 RelE/StbE family toxin [Oleiphilus messinensis]
MRARRQLKEIYHFIAEDSETAAERVTDEMVEYSMQLDTLPYRHHMTPELKDEYVREFSMYSYRVIFEILPDDIIAVIAVVHKRQNIRPKDITRA